jgi:hypothetical protein
MLVAGSVFAVFCFGLAGAYASDDLLRFRSSLYCTGQAELAPMGAATMIFNEILAWKARIAGIFVLVWCNSCRLCCARSRLQVLREPFTRVDAAATLLMGLGTTVALIYGEKGDVTYTLDLILGLMNRPVVYAGISVTVAILVAVSGTSEEAVSHIVLR